MKFNKRLSQLEAVYQIAPPVGVVADSMQISDFIHHIFENTEKYGLSNIDDEWFTYCAINHKPIATKLIMDKLNESGHIVNMKSLNEGIETFLLEGLTEEVRLKYYPTISEELFNKYISADPTGGKYQKWILNLYKNGLKEEDLYKVTDYLKLFDKYKAKLAIKDINQIKSLSELFKLVEPIKIKLEQGDKSLESSNEQARIAKSQTDKVYEDGQWLILSPKTKESACYYGKGTQWCTAAETSNNMFDHYNNKGKLYIIIDKNHSGQGGKWQFHQDTNSFMDANDTPVKNIETIFPVAVLEKITELYGLGNILTKITDFEISKHLVDKYSDPESFKEIYGVFNHLLHSNKHELAMYILDKYVDMIDPVDISSMITYFSYPTIKPQLFKLLDVVYEKGMIKHINMARIILLGSAILKDQTSDDVLYDELTTDKSSGSVNRISLNRFKKLMNACKESLESRVYYLICFDMIEQCLTHGINDDELYEYLLSLQNYDPYHYASLLNDCFAHILNKGIDYLINNPNFKIYRKTYNSILEVYGSHSSRKELIDKLKNIDPSKIIDEE